MNKEQQRIAIAEWCGFDMRHVGDARKDLATFPDSHHEAILTLWKIPDYTSDLNAIHEAEEQIDRELYTAQLLAVIHNVDSDYFSRISWENGYELATATASQRAEALLRTVGKWDDSK